VVRRFYHLGGGDKFEGPFTVEEIRERLRDGRIREDALLQLEGSLAKVPLSDVPELEEPTGPPLYYYARGAEKRGPFGAEDIRRFLSTGVLKPSDQVLRKGTSDWTPIAAMPEFGGSPAAVKPPAPAPRPAPRPVTTTAGAATLAGRPALEAVPYKPGARPSLPGFYTPFALPPADVASLIDRVESAQAAYDRSRRRVRWPIVLLLIAAGTGAAAVDAAMGMDSHIFTVLTPFAWVGALLVLVATRRRGGGRLPAGPARERLRACRDVLDALAGDAAPGKAATGWIDLTGAEQSGKVLRKGQTARGAPIHLYRDEWFHLKLPLRDGNRLHVAAVERRKVKSPRWKRRGSKPGSTRSLSTFELRLAVNPALYAVQPHDGTGARFGALELASFAAKEGAISAVAIAKEPRFASGEALQMLAFAYRHLRRRAGAA
jgi:hypothetical protein